MNRKQYGTFILHLTSALSGNKPFHSLCHEVTGCLVKWVRTSCLPLYFAEKESGTFERLSGTCRRFDLEVMGQTLNCWLLVHGTNVGLSFRRGYE